MKKLTTLVFAFMLTASMAFAQGNTATSTSNGSHNSSTIEQDGSSNSATVTQSGTSNSAFIDQGIQGITSNNDVANINQVGNGNDAELSSRDGYGSSSASVIYNVNQQGNYNHARARAFNAPAEGDIDQSGSHNSVDLTQHTSDDMYAEISQSGAHNWADIDQVHGANNSVLQATMNGSHNDLDVTQTNGSWHKLVVDISGSSNSVTGTQDEHDSDGFASVSGHGNTYDFYQGESSDAGVSISGNYNDVDLQQNGAHNSVFATVPWEYNGIVVNGSHNSVDITQNSNNNTATANVSGAFNTTTIIQGGGEVAME